MQQVEQSVFSSLRSIDGILVVVADKRRISKICKHCHRMPKSESNAFETQWNPNQTVFLEVFKIERYNI